eukprot:CAMPEP_0114985054 /NCGR_PEP_ID=MMETSP0216-20121206/7637_1 /TAXON_ID=223996 /ORGANISM="Protocruzia adherens, Strain Boccale" /LENGTH=110 /DNA_ID=CAMNT_0002347295 /DNA_START=101 /DNA_END=430 /DNA_ORIENTATION=-
MNFALSASLKDDGVIDYHEFCQALSIPTSLMTDRIFSIFDLNGDKVINFREFLFGLSVFLNETLENKITLSFKLFDNESTGETTVSEMTELIESSIQLVDGVYIPKDVIH